jgi:hypothetical protein
MVILEVKITPKTWVRAPVATKEQVKRYVQKGWISQEDEGIDRVFPRTNEGKPFIPKIWLEACMVRASKMLGINTKFSRTGWRIVKKVGTLYIPTGYIEIPETPLKYSRAILGEERPTKEVFEFIDGTYTLTFLVETDEPTKFIDVLGLAGEVGIMSITGKGYGKFTAEVRVLEEEEAKKLIQTMKMKRKGE